VLWSIFCEALSLAVRLLQFSSLPSYKYNKTLLTLRPEGVTKSRNLIARTVARRAPGAKKKWRVPQYSFIYKISLRSKFLHEAQGETKQVSRSLSRLVSLAIRFARSLLLLLSPAPVGKKREDLRLGSVIMRNHSQGTQE
jgi:hypothetical protein